MPESKKYWFQKKRYGWGWGLPVAWQGCFVLVIYVVLLAVGAAELLSERAPAVFMSYSGLVTLVLIAIWVLVGMIPYIFVSSEFFLQKFPDEYHWRLQRPPPLEYPDPEDTPDRRDEQLFKSKEYKYLQEAGLVGDPFFTIQGQKKIYTKESGVNQPMDEI